MVLVLLVWNVELIINHQLIIPNAAFKMFNNASFIPLIARLAANAKHF